MPGLTEPNQSLKREDLSDIIVNVDAKNEPFFSMARKGKPLKNTLYSFPVDAYDEPNTDGVVDGADATEFQDRTKNRAKLNARVQKFRETWGVSDMSEEVSDVAGVASEKAESMAKCIVQVKRNIESALCSDNESQEDDGVNPYKLRGLGKWIQNGAQTDLPVPANYRTPAASISTTATTSLTETDIQNVLQSIWEQTGAVQSYTGLCGASFKRALTEMTRVKSDVGGKTHIMRYNHEGASKEIFASIDIFVGDFGTITLVPSQRLAHGSAIAERRARCYVLDMSKVSIRTKRLPGGRELPDLGGGPRGFVDAILSLQVSNPLGFGKFSATS